MTELTPFDEGYVAPEPAAKPAAGIGPKPFPDEPARRPRAPRAAAAPKSGEPRAMRRAKARQVDADEAAEPDYPTEIADGIYFGMVDDAYHAIHRYSTSGIQATLVSPATFWAGSWLNPDRVDRPRAARIIGRAYHAARLEPELFAANYVRQLDKSEMPDGTLFTGDDMTEALRELGYPVSGSVAEQAGRLDEAGYTGTVWHLELARWEATRAGRIGLPAVTFDEIAEDGRRLRASPAIAELLTGGAAEVSVFWTCQATGIKMKARLDYLKERAWADLKTFENTRGKRLEQAIADAFRYNRYYIQAVSYREAVEAIRNGLVDIVGDCEPWQRELIDAVQLSAAPLACWYVFQEKGGVPNILGRRFKFDDLPVPHTLHAAGLDEQREARAAQAVGRPTAITRKALVEIAHAKKLFAGYSEIYEPGEPWLPIEPLSDIGDEDFSPYWLEGRDE